MRLLSLLLFIVFFGCGEKIEPNNDNEQEKTPIDWTSLDLSEDFIIGSFNEEGINSEELDYELESLSKSSDLFSVGILYKGKLITERYFSSNSDTKYPIWSVTKSIISAGYGHLIQDGLLDNTEVPISNYYTLNSAKKSAITISHLLTMSSGVGDDIGYAAQNQPVDYILSQPLFFDPGSWWAYTSAGTHILSDIIVKITGQSTKSYIDENILNKIGIDDYEWITQNGVHNGGYGIFFRLMDMLRFGQFFLQEGRSGNVQILPRQWINVSTGSLVDFNASSGYGFLWWVSKNGPEETYSARGYAGQYIVVDPQRALVICVTSQTRYNNFDYLNRIDSLITQLIDSFEPIQ